MALLSRRNLTLLSCVHSVIFGGLVLCAFALGKPQPATFILGLSHGVLYPLMAIACAVAARRKTISLTTALVVIVLGAAGPFFGTIDFLWAERGRQQAEAS